MFLHNILVDPPEKHGGQGPAMPPIFSFIYLGPCLRAHGMNQNPRPQNSLQFPRITCSPSVLLSGFSKVISVSKGKRCNKGQLTRRLLVTGGEFKDGNLIPPPFYRWDNEDIKKLSDLGKITQPSAWQLGQGLPFIYVSIWSASCHT